MERGPKNGNFEAGQPINTEDAMNDTPKNAVDAFAARVQARVEDGTYTQEEADALIEKAKARHEEKEQQAIDQAAYDAWANMTPAEAKTKSDAFENEFTGEQGQDRISEFTLYPRQAGETNEEYGARLRRMHEATAKFQAENPVEEGVEKTALDKYKEMVEARVESGDLKREDADKMIENREADFGKMQDAKVEEARNEDAKNNFDESQEKAKMELAERIRKEVPEALEFLEKHPELKTEMAAAVRKLEELEELAKIEDGAKNAIDTELAHRNEAFMNAVEAFNAAARANEAARAKMEELEKGGKATDEELQAVEDEIHKTENDMKVADANKKNAESEYNAAEAAIRADAEKRAGDLRDKMSERDKYVDEEREYYNKHYGKAKEDYLAAKEANEAARAKMEELEKGGKATDEELQAAEDEIHATEKAIADAKARMEEYKQDQADAADVMDEWVKMGVDKKKAGEAGDAGKGGEAGDAGKGGEAGDGGAEKDDDKDFEAFVSSYLNDKEFCAIYTRNGVFDEEACRAAVRNLYDAKKAQEAKEAAGAEEDDETNADEFEYTDEDFEDLDDDFENEEQKGLFAKLRGFFNRNKRSKKGAENAANKAGLRGWKKAVVAAMLALALGSQAANLLQGTGLFNQKEKANDTGTEVETEAAVVASAEDDDKNKEVPLEEVAEDLSLEVDLNAEKAEELKDMIHGKVEGVETDLSVSAGEWSGVSAYFDENKTSRYAIGSPVYDREHASEMTRFEISKQIFEGVAERLDDPAAQAQWVAAFAGSDLVYHDDNGNYIKGINSIDDLNRLLDMLQTDDEARKYFAEFCKKEYAELGEKYEVRSRTIKQGETYTSTYILNMAPEGEQPRMTYFIDWQCTANVDKNEMYFVDENGVEITNTNEIGGFKYNIMKSLGLIDEDATDEEAIAIMEKYDLLGIIGDCGGTQVDIRERPDTGTEKETTETGTEKETEESGEEKDTDETSGTEKETEETGTEKETEETGTEKETEETGTEKETEETGTEKETEETGTEKETAETGTEKETEETGTEKETAETGTEKETAETGTEKETIETGTEKETAETGTEKETDETGDGKTDILPGDEDDGWDVINHPTEEETGPTSEADRTPVDEGGNGYVNDETQGSSSNLAEDDFLNGGDQGGGNTDADGGGSTNPETEATYDGTDTSGWQGETPSDEQGTQTIDEPSTAEEVNAYNDSEANPDTAGEDVTDPDQIQNDHDAMADRF